METAASSPFGFTAADILDLFGPIAACRIVPIPFPGQATEDDLVRDRLRKERRCELIHRTLVARMVPFYHAVIATRVGVALSDYAHGTGRGIAINSIACVRFTNGDVLAPAAAFIDWYRIPGGRIPREEIADIIPNVVAEIMYAGIAEREIERKLDGFFLSGVELAWCVDPDTETVRVYTARAAATTLTEADTLDGGSVLPGFSVKVADLFVERNA